MSKPKIIVWDIETSLEETYTFQLSRKSGRYTPFKNVKVYSHLICVAWKELGSRKTHEISLLDDIERFNKDPHDDYYVVKETADVLRNADMLIAHNGDRFDLKMLNARLAYHKLPPLPPIVTVDTLKKARQLGEFPANSLDNLAEFFGLGHKMQTDFDLWVKAFEGDEKAIRYMSKYCKKDVVLNEKVYVRLRPYMKTHPNIATESTLNCPKCNSHKVHKHKNRRLSSGIERKQYQCQSCGSYFTERNSVESKPFSM